MNIGCVAGLGESKALPSLPHQRGAFSVGFGIAELQIGFEEGSVIRGGGGEMAVGGLRLQPERAGRADLPRLPQAGPPRSAEPPARRAAAQKGWW